MNGTGISEELDDRVARLERALAQTIDQIDRRSAQVEDRVRRLERARPASAGRDRVAAASVDRPAPDQVAFAPPISGRPLPIASDEPAGRARVDRAADERVWDPTALSDLVGGRLLAWLGGVAMVVGILLFLALAISHGWIGQQARVLLAGAGSAALLAGGAWLRGHRGRTEAATAMVGAGTAGMFATLVVAGEVYRLAPPLVCLAAALVVGAVATTLAISWAGRPIAALGFGGALLAPILVGAPSGIPTLAMLAIATAYATLVAAREGWGWLGLGTLVVSAPQWAFWALGHRSALAEVLVIGGFGLLALAGGLAPESESAATEPRGAAATVGRSPSATVAMLCLNACIAGLVGYVAILANAGHAAAVLWLVALAAVHAGVGLASRLQGWVPTGLPGSVRTDDPGSLLRGLPGSVATGYRRVAAPTDRLVLGLGVLLADVAFGLAAHGIVLTAGWAAVTVGLAWELRRRSAGSRPLEVGLGAHVALVMIRVVLAAPPDATSGSLVGLLSIAILAAASLACAQLSTRDRPSQAAGLNALGLAAIAYLTAGALDGPTLASAWALEGLALIRLAGTGREPTPWIGGLAFLGMAAAHALVFDAPPAGLVAGVDDLGAAAVALAAIACAAIAGGRVHPPATTERRGLLAAGAAAVLYLASVALVTAFQRHTAGAGVLDLSVGQQAQVALSGLWTLAGLAAVVLGLRRRLGALRIGGLAVLLVSVGKVFTYDLSALGSIYRIASVLTLGLLLLVAALTYQRLRPPPLPDLRTLQPSQR